MSNREIDWEKQWQESHTPWDKGESSPALIKFLKEHSDLIPSKGKGLVPGTGSGYDVVLFSSPDLHMTGLDMSPTCIKQAQKKHGDGNYDFICDDFYTFEYPKGGYDLVYDYTFLCAMPLDMRPAWGKRMAEIIKPGGVLIALMYPLNDRSSQPPNTVSVSLFHELLDENFENIFLEDAIGHSDRIGDEKMSVWKRK
ncbi:S-adenosyl-L-methionine-dependent methyltransferase [Circinella umbellata]|nr:S-adenosyl-L-methionine-dependent methyltransferase [Circinella umbellata]